MNNDINILLNQGSEELKQQQKIRLFRRIASAVSAFVGITSFIIFALTLYINPVSIKKEQESVKTQIAKYENKKAKLFLINNRVDDVKEVLGKRKDFSKTIDTLLAQMPSELAINEMEVSNNKAVITVSSSSLSSLGEFLDRLLGMAKRKNIISTLKLISLSLDPDKNNYIVSLESNF